MDMETYRKIAEVNLFGVIGGLKMFLPLIRKRLDIPVQGGAGGLAAGLG